MPFQSVINITIYKNAIMLNFVFMFQDLKKQNRKYAYVHKRKFAELYPPCLLALNEEFPSFSSNAHSQWGVPLIQLRLMRGPPHSVERLGLNEDSPSFSLKAHSEWGILLIQLEGSSQWGIPLIQLHLMRGPPHSVERLGLNEGSPSFSSRALPNEELPSFSSV